MADVEIQPHPRRVDRIDELQLDISDLLALYPDDPLLLGVLAARQSAAGQAEAAGIERLFFLSDSSDTGLDQAASAITTPTCAASAQIFIASWMIMYTASTPT